MTNLSTVDVAAVRLWLDQMVQPDTPSNVMAGFDQGVGATFFDLNSLQVLHITQDVHVVQACRASCWVVSDR